VIVVAVVSALSDGDAAPFAQDVSKASAALTNLILT